MGFTKIMAASDPHNATPQIIDLSRPAPVVVCPGGPGVREMGKVYFDAIYVLGDREQFIPKGFYTDWASIPWWGRPFFPWWQKRNHPPVCHDVAYATHALSRQDADDFYYELMIACGYDRPRAYAQYKAVRVGGAKGYDETSPRQFRERTPDLYERYYVG